LEALDAARSHRRPTPLRPRESEHTLGFTIDGVPMMLAASGPPMATGRYRVFGVSETFPKPSDEVPS
jgi:hypothetical protein